MLRERCRCQLLFGGNGIPDISVVLLEAYDVSAEHVRNARELYGSFDLGLKTTNYGSITSAATEAARSMGADTRTDMKHMLGGWIGLRYNNVRRARRRACAECPDNRQRTDQDYGKNVTGMTKSTPLLEPRCRRRIGSVAVSHFAPHFLGEQHSIEIGVLECRYLALFRTRAYGSYRPKLTVQNRSHAPVAATH